MMIPVTKMKNLTNNAKMMIVMDVRLRMVRRNKKTKKTMRMTKKTMKKTKKI